MRGAAGNGSQPHDCFGPPDKESYTQRGPATLRAPIHTRTVLAVLEVGVLRGKSHLPSQSSRRTCCSSFTPAKARDAPGANVSKEFLHPSQAKARGGASTNLLRLDALEGRGLAAAGAELRLLAQATRLLYRPIGQKGVWLQARDRTPLPLLRCRRATLPLRTGLHL